MAQARIFFNRKLNITVLKHDVLLNNLCCGQDGKKVGISLRNGVEIMLPFQ